VCCSVHRPEPPTAARNQTGHTAITMLQCVAVWCSVVQCVTVQCSVLQYTLQSLCCSVLQCVAVCYRALQCVAVRCNEMQCSCSSRATDGSKKHDKTHRNYTVANVLQCVAVRHSVLQCVAVRCIALQSVAVFIVQSRQRQRETKQDTAQSQWDYPD